MDDPWENLRAWSETRGRVANTTLRPTTIFRANGAEFRPYDALTRTCRQGNDLHGTKYFS